MRLNEMTDEQLIKEVDDDALARELYSRRVLARHRVSEQVQALEHQRDKAQADYENAMSKIGQLEHQANRYEKSLDFNSVIGPAILKWVTDENELLVRRIWDDVRRAVKS